MILCPANNPKIAIFSIYAWTLMYSLFKTLRYFQRILHIRLNSFCVFSEYAERMKNMQKEMFTFDNYWGPKRDSISKKLNGVIFWPWINSFKCYFLIYFWLSLKRSFLSSYLENMHKGEKQRKTASTSQLINGPTWKNCRSFISLQDELD